MSLLQKPPITKRSIYCTDTISVTLHIDDISENEGFCSRLIKLLTKVQIDY